MNDARDEISAVGRRVERRPLHGQEGRTAVISRCFNATIEEVWDACTNPERVVRWLMPLSGDLHSGGRYQLKGNAGGTIESCDPPTSLAATWEYGGEVDRVELRLSPAGENETRLELAHTVREDSKWDEYGPGAVGPGWEFALAALGGELGPKDDTRRMEPGWAGSKQGEDFIRLSSARWCEAHIAAGADTAHATQAAERTAAFWSRPAPQSATHVGNASGRRTNII
jgi:uncharacterized protein YndB with AHSA1/START domain